jgi:squalene-hopene/tetraprenyl-beta-curcumene cyclase
VQTPINRVLLLWAAARLPGLLEPARQKAIIGELLEKQRVDGGWSLSSLSGGWKRADGTSQEMTSDGYATGLITFVLQRAGISPENAKLKRGLAWLTANQDKKEGSWVSYSLNKNKENHISPETALFMNDAATSFSVLSLTAANRRKRTVALSLPTCGRISGNCYLIDKGRVADYQGVGAFRQYSGVHGR